MKTIQALFVFTFILLSSTAVSAQYGNNGYGGGGYGNGGYGRNGGMSQMNQSRDQDKPREIPAEVTVAKIMESLLTANQNSLCVQLLQAPLQAHLP